jgi:tetratricopeptide (TPR) repeat protein
LLGLALAQTNLLQGKDAVASFEKGLKLFPRDARFYAEYGKVLLLPWASGEIAGADARAEQLLKKAIELDASLAMAHFELGSLLVKSQRAAEALPHMEKAVQFDARNAQAHFVLARAYRTLGKTAEAEREMLLFQKLQPAASGKGSNPPDEQ